MSGMGRLGLEPNGKVLSSLERSILSSGDSRVHYAWLVPNRRYSIEFWQDENGRKPVLDWIKNELADEQRAALGKAMQHTLQVLGVGVCGSQFGKQLGDGLCEFRLRYDLAELRHRFEGKDPESVRASSRDVLLRVFFHAYGDKVLLLLHGYDKAADTSPRRQHREIAEARRRLRAFRERQHRT